MQITCWRLTKAKYASEALSGYGSMLRDGRWHRRGRPMVYAAEHPALALLETMVHVEDDVLLDFEYVTIPIRITDDHVETLSVDELPADWNSWPWPDSTKALGSAWFDEQGSVVLEVPSAVAPTQSNYLINPRHPAFDQLGTGGPEPFPIDPRLTGG